MRFEARSWTLFGLDLPDFGRRWRNGWEEALRWSAFAWLSPEEPVRVLFPDGGEAVCLGPGLAPAPPGAVPRAVAVVLPESDALVRELALPRLTDGELRDALALEVAAINPFPPDQAVWGWRAEPEDDRLRVRLALAARREVDAHLEREVDRIAGAAVEVWAEGGTPVVLQGFAEHRRAARIVARRRQILAALVAALVLLFVLAATPVLQAGQRAVEAQARYEALKDDTADVTAARSELATANDRVRALRALVAERLDAAWLIETLSRILPDDAFLTRLEVRGRQVRITGQAANASQLMDALSAAGPFRDVRAPSPISRPVGADRESFVIELVVADEGAAR